MVDQEAYKQVAWKIVLMLNFEVVFRLQFLKNVPAEWVLFLATMCTCSFFLH